MKFILAGILGVVLLAQAQEILPVLDSIPQTSFSCQDRIYGYYADVEADCQAFHICLAGQRWTFLCPNQTQFNQEHLVCDFHANVDCPAAEQLYVVNENFGVTDQSI